MLFSTQEIMLRRKLEQEAELQHALELQGRRMMNLQLMDLKNQHHNHHHLLQGFRAGIPMSSPRQSQFLMNQNFMAASDGLNQENFEGSFLKNIRKINFKSGFLQLISQNIFCALTAEFDGRQEAAKSPNMEGNEFSNDINGCDKQQHNVNGDDSNLPER